jgi:uncharacterized protein (UPF0335 family)
VRHREYPWWAILLTPAGLPREHWLAWPQRRGVEEACHASQATIACLGQASGASHQQARERSEAMAQSTEPLETAVDLQVVREFLERYFTIENEMKVLQQDKTALRDEFKGRGLDMKTMTAAIAIAKKRQLVQVSRETLDALISEVEEKLPAPED